MPYFVFRVTEKSIVKNLEKLAEFEQFKQAKLFARDCRAKQVSDDDSTIKVIFADNALEAEERLQEKREAPIIREWEK